MAEPTTSLLDTTSGCHQRVSKAHDRYTHNAQHTAHDTRHVAYHDAGMVGNAGHDFGNDGVHVLRVDATDERQTPRHERLVLQQSKGALQAHDLA